MLGVEAQRLPSPLRFRWVRGRQIRYGYAACGMDRQAPVRPPLDRFQRAFDIDFRAFLSAVSGDQSRDLARFATRLNPLTPLFRHRQKFSAHETRRR